MTHCVQRTLPSLWGSSFWISHGWHLLCVCQVYCPDHSVQSVSCSPAWRASPSTSTSRTMAEVHSPARSSCFLSWCHQGGRSSEDPRMPHTSETTVEADTTYSTVLENESLIDRHRTSHCWSRRPSKHFVSRVDNIDGSQEKCNLFICIYLFYLSFGAVSWAFATISLY